MTEECGNVLFRTRNGRPGTSDWDRSLIEGRHDSCTLEGQEPADLGDGGLSVRIELSPVSARSRAVYRRI